MREDRILAHLPALLIQLGEPSRTGQQPADGQPPIGTDAAARLRERGVTLTYQPAAHTLSAGADPEEGRILID